MKSPVRITKGSIRKGVLFLHLWLGLVIGLYFSVVGVSGSILVFREELEVSQVMPERAKVEPPSPDAKMLPLGKMLDQLRADFPQVRPDDFSLVVPPVQPGGAYLVRLNIDKENRATTINPYTGKVIQQVVMHDTWIDWVDRLHVYLLADALGRITNGYAGLLAGLLLLSGLWLWWPMTIRQLKIRLTVKRSGGIQRLVKDLHNVLGIYPFVLLLVVTLTGSVIIFYKPVQAVVLKFTGPGRRSRTPVVKPQDGVDRLPIDRLLVVADGIAPQSKYVFLLYPTRTNQAFYAYKRASTGIWPDTRIYIDTYTAKVLKVETEVEDPAVRKIMRSASTIHFGGWGSLFSKILYFVLGFLPVGLFVTGVMMYIHKRQNKAAAGARRRAKAGQPETAPDV